jgi:FlaA1/EpsC-like NDP-sugar epimerase
MFGAVLVNFLLSFILIAMARIARPVVRDLFYALDCSRLRGRKDVSRILIYGAGLRYRSFRRELVRRTTANNRIIVGLLDDDVLMRGQYIGGIKVYGTLMEAPEIINVVNADAVVVACEVSDQWLNVIRKTLAPTGVKITHFTFSEKEI